MYRLFSFDGTIFTKTVQSLKSERLDRRWHLSDVKYNRAMQIASLYIVTITTCGAILFV